MAQKTQGHPPFSDWDSANATQSALSLSTNSDEKIEKKNHRTKLLPRRHNTGLAKRLYSFEK